MATLNEITNNIRNIVRGGKSSIADSISLKQIKFLVNGYRAMFIRRDIERQFGTTDLLRPFEQDLGCVKLIIVDKAECCSIDLDCDILRTEFQIPKTVRLRNREGITFIGSVDKQTSFQLILPEEARFIQYKTFTKDIKRAYILNRYIYIPNDPTFELENINIRGIFENPEEAANFVDCDDIPCYDDNTEYPVPMDYIPQITEAILQKEMGIMISRIPDNVDDNISQ